MWPGAAPGCELVVALSSFLRGVGDDAPVVRTRPEDSLAGVAVAAQFEGYVFLITASLALRLASSMGPVYAGPSWQHHHCRLRG